jgi:hypothetical protein
MLMRVCTRQGIFTSAAPSRERPHEATRCSLDSLGELGRLEQLELATDVHHQRDHRIDRVSAHHEHRVRVRLGLEHAEPGREARAQRRYVAFEAKTRAETVWGGGDRTCHESRDSLGGELGNEAPRVFGELHRTNAVDTKGTEVVSVHVAGGQVPKASGMHETQGLDRALRGVPAGVFVRERDLELVSAGGREGGENTKVHSDFRTGQERGGLLDGTELSTHPRRHDALELGQHAERDVFHIGDSAGRRSQSDRDRDGFVVVEQKRRRARARAEPISASRSGRRRDHVAEVSQAIHVATECAHVDLESLPEVSTRPFSTRLEHAEKSQSSNRSGRHEAKLSRTVSVRNRP